MWTVWKYSVPMRDVFEVDLPDVVRVLHVGVKDGVASMWVWMDSAAPRRTWRFGIVGTGAVAPRPGAAIHVGTFVDGGFVWHVFAHVTVEARRAWKELA